MGVAFVLVPYLACGLVESGLGFLIINAGPLKPFHGVIKQPLVEVSSLLGITCTSYVQDSAAQELHTTQVCNVHLQEIT